MGLHPVEQRPGNTMGVVPQMPFSFLFLEGRFEPDPENRLLHPGKIMVMSSSCCNAIASGHFVWNPLADDLPTPFDDNPAFIAVVVVIVELRVTFVLGRITL